MDVRAARDHDQDQLQQLTEGAKRALRQQLRGLRQALPEAAAAARSQRIVAQLSQHPRILAARRVALFWPILDRREIDLRPLDRLLRTRGATLYYPYMRTADAGDVETGFRVTASADDLVIFAQRFAQPPTSAKTAERADIDVVVVPALAATVEGHRLGYGSGFYDATLPDVCPPAYSIVVVHDFQLLLELPRELHDRACDEVVTD